MFWRLIGLGLVGYLGTKLLSGKSGSRNAAYAEGQPHERLVIGDRAGHVGRHVGVGEVDDVLEAERAVVPA